MHVNKLVTFGILITLFFSSCHNSAPLIADEETYIKKIEEWQQSRIDRLKGKTGWLNLAGLYWLKEGENSFGSDSDNDIVFPQKAQAFCGTLTLDSGRIYLEVQEGAHITLEGKAVDEMELRDDHSKPVTYLEQGDLAWYIIKRGEKYGIRMRDYKHPRIDELDHIPAYPISTSYVLEAKLRAFPEARTITVATPVEGFTESYQCPGELEFRLHGKKLSLLPFISGTGYFLVLGDETSAVETYGAGRFMYVQPDSSGRIILDFNKAYNPPCAFSPFATCPMPPKENILPVPVEAGEKAVHLD